MFVLAAFALTWFVKNMLSGNICVWRVAGAEVQVLVAAA